MWLPRATPTQLVVEEGRAEPAVPWIEGDVLRMGPGRPAFRLAHPIADAECFYAVAVAPDRRQVLYGALPLIRPPGQAGEPIRVEDLPPLPPGLATLRLLDVESGTDRAFEQDAYDPAWGQQGQIACIQALGARPFRVRVGQVLVRETLASPWAVWAQGRYFGLTWVGARLLGYRAATESATTDVVVLDGPERVRVLARDAAVIAVSANGTQVLVTPRISQDEPKWAIFRNPSSGNVERFAARHDAPPSYTTTASLLSVDDGTEVVRLELPGVMGLAAAGVWSGDLVLTTADVQRRSLLVVLGVNDSKLEIVRAFEFTGEYLERETEWRGRHAVVSPRFLDAGLTRVGAWMSLSLSVRGYLECDLTTGRCILDTRYAIGHFVHG
jgi:hypothetical protein